MIFIGLGFPFEGPSPIEALQAGCYFINPIWEPPIGRVLNGKNPDEYIRGFFNGKPTVRQLESQVPYLATINRNWVQKWVYLCWLYRCWRRINCHGCWWRNVLVYKMLVTILVNWVTNIHYRFASTSGTDIQKMSPRSKFCHQHPKIVNNSKSFISLSPVFSYNGLYWLQFLYVGDKSSMLIIHIFVTNIT